MIEKEKPAKNSSGAAIITNTEVPCSPIDDLLSKLNTSQNKIEQIFPLSTYSLQQI